MGQRNIYITEDTQRDMLKMTSALSLSVSKVLNTLYEDWRAGDIVSSRLPRGDFDIAPAVDEADPIPPPELTNGMP